MKLCELLECSADQLLGLDRRKRKAVERKLRFYDGEVLRRLDEAIDEDPLKPSMNAWIVQAIMERLDQEESGRPVGE